jgi:hypothetical protein
MFSRNDFSPIIPEIGEKVTGFFSGVLFYYSINALLKE